MFYFSIVSTCRLRLLVQFIYNRLVTIMMKYLGWKGHIHSGGYIVYLKSGKIIYFMGGLEKNFLIVLCIKGRSPLPPEP